MRLFVTILEETQQDAISAIRALELDHDGIEVRAERMPELDLVSLRAATRKPIILTYRGGRAPSVERALAAGIDLVDVEWSPGVEITVPARTIVSHHDYAGMRDAAAILEQMRALGCVETKLAMTPLCFADNQELLALQEDRGVSVIGMGERGLYSRILAPFRGSSLTFVSPASAAAPGQLTLERALQIYGESRETLEAGRVFAVVGNPAGHSLSPSIHNALFREKKVSAAYTIASVERFDEVTKAFAAGEPCGLSVTAPFKEDAFAFAQTAGATIGENALRARAVNTLVNIGGGILADNTDVDGFAALIPDARRAAVIGAGGTARAALVALENAGIDAIVYNRTASKGDAPLEALPDFTGDLIINTLPAGVDVPVPRCRIYIEAAYGGASRTVEADTYVGGTELLRAQARRQHELFMKVFA